MAEAGAWRAQLVETRELALLQEVGVCEYEHPLDDALACQVDWAVNGSLKEGQKPGRDITIGKLGALMRIVISPDYHRQRLHEIDLTADSLVKAKAEAERDAAGGEGRRRGAGAGAGATRGGRRPDHGGGAPRGERAGGLRLRDLQRRHARTGRGQDRSSPST
ncbi:hypothetical protein [Saccharothrix texasensis]|uniref:Uncharacterized protein n=1 Tax=Saccharothrix texasensis TaxID=103734 RepID=A0A3N1H1Y8_9PSEU|nr:hypothetical protein [Saccharothrix texasensis]ROP36458.1 hypothetical protein EDD40_1729 [Saccharothrix texasensis]